jgi:glycosyltransferase involved in cell wall biosynthesis
VTRVSEPAPGSPRLHAANGALTAALPVPNGATAVLHAAQAPACVHAGHHAYLTRIELPFQLPTPFYGAMLAIWYLRPALQRRFPLQSGETRDYLRFLAWLATEGRRSYEILRGIPEWDAALARPMALPPVDGDLWAGGYSVAMFLYGVARQRYTFGGMLSNAGVRARVARGFWRGARHDRRCPPPDAWQLAFVAARFGTLKAFVEYLRNPVEREHTPAALIEHFDLHDVKPWFSDRHANGCAEVQDAGALNAVRLPAPLRRSPMRLPIRLIRSLHWAFDRFAREPAEAGYTQVMGAMPFRRQRGPITAPFGVNLFGFARGEIGIGEDVRQVALALQSQGIPICIINIAPGANVSQRDASAEVWITDAPRYAINLFCGTGIELSRYVCELGPKHFEGRYTIGLWPWELPHWPQSAWHTYNLVDEIWGISQHTAASYRDAPCAVRPMTLPVTLGPVGDEDRALFGLPEDDYLFVFSFDVNSTIARKNPLATVRAFQLAFPPKHNARVGLVIKVSHTEDVRLPEWSRLKSMIAGDPRIHLIGDTLRRPQVLALYRCCDCFVSLHRAEGFGRGIAEALLLDLQVIATGFSGNLDFCSDDRVGLVRYRMTPLARGDYFHGDGQEWAEPDLGHAAELMREIVSKPRPIPPRGFDFSPSGVGRRYARRLFELERELKLEGTLPC